MNALYVLADLFKPVTNEELSSIDEIKSEGAEGACGDEIIRIGDERPKIYTTYQFPATLLCA
jgi:hypothetical protein